MNDLVEQVQEAVELITMAMEDTSDEDLVENLEAAVEILEDVEHTIGLEQEMDEMMGKHRENIEDLDEI